MTESLPWVMYLFYITSGYMLVIAATAVSVAIVSRSQSLQLYYGSLTVAALAGTGYQITTMSYYQATTESGALQALYWQVDFATLAVFSIALFFALSVRRSGLPKAVMCVGAALVVLLILSNRLSSFSLHFDHIPLLVQYKLKWATSLQYLQGVAGIGAWFWYGIACSLVMSGFYWVYLSWRHTSSFYAILGGACLVFELVCLLLSCLIDIGFWDGLYPFGFAVFLCVFSVSVVMAAEAAQRSRRLIEREKEMAGEIRQRRRAEDKLERLSQVFMQAPTATHIIDLKGKTIQVNEESIRFLRRDVGVPPKVNFIAVLNKLGEDTTALIKDLSAGKVKEYGPYFFTAGLPVDSLYFIKDSWLDIKLYPIFNKARELQECVVRLEDITERQFVDNAIKTISAATSAETGQAFFTQLVVHLAKLLNKKYVYIGLKKQEGFDGSIDSLAIAEGGELIDNVSFSVPGTVIERVFDEGVFSVPKQVGRVFPEDSFLSSLHVESFIGVAITNESKVPIGIIAVLDVKPMEQVKQVEAIVKIFVSRAGSELQRIDAEKQIRAMAYEDHLTGLPNRSELTECVAGLLKRKATNIVSGFIQIDLDHFKTINDALGHNVGDEVLRFVGRRLHQIMGDATLVARIGGDEFGVVVDNLGEYPQEQLDFLTHQFIAVMTKPVQIGDHLLDVGCTIGAVIFPEYAETVVDVFRYADIALNKAKAKGRGGYQLFTPEMHSSVSIRLSMEKGLRRALQKNELSLFFQPQVDAFGNMMGAEALVRWHHPKKGWISPVDFIPVAEETGFINPLGQWVLENALSQRKYWSETRVAFSGHLSVNVSSWQFARPDFVETTMIAIEEMQVPPAHITLEVTETALLGDIKDTIDKLSELRRFGVSIALDDFGTGYSSLAYLRDLPLDILKIDKTFVDALESNAQEPLVESMISIGRHMGLQVIAEGVETTTQLERLKTMGCNVFQGYLFSKPLERGEFVAWMNKTGGQK